MPRSMERSPRQGWREFASRMGSWWSPSRAGRIARSNSGSVPCPCISTTPTMSRSFSTVRTLLCRRQGLPRKASNAEDASSFPLVDARTAQTQPGTEMGKAAPIPSESVLSLRLGAGVPLAVGVRGKRLACGCSRNPLTQLTLAVASGGSRVASGTAGTGRAHPVPERDSRSNQRCRSARTESLSQFRPAAASGGSRVASGTAGTGRAHPVPERDSRSNQRCRSARMDMPQTL